MSERFTRIPCQFRDQALAPEGAGADVADTARQPPFCAQTRTRAQSVLELCNVTVRSRKERKTLLLGVNLCVGAEAVAIVGPSGVGKTTLLRCLNRMTDLFDVEVTGDVLYKGKSVFARSFDADDHRSRVAMLFQQPVVFPTTVYNNVIFGLRHLSQSRRRDRPAIAEQALRRAALWDEVKDRLSEPAEKLSVGQQQRLCLARAMATGPEVLLMDEPTSALDPESTERIERLICDLKETHTIVLVTHSLRQASKVADRIVRLESRGGAGQIEAVTA